MRIGIGIASLTMSVLFAAQTMGIIPNVPQAVLDGRKALCENVAIECSLAVSHNEISTVKAVIAGLLKRNGSVVSAAIRRDDGKLLAEVGDHQAHWVRKVSALAPGLEVEVPVFRGQRRWGTVEICFMPIEKTGWTHWLASPALRLIFFVTSAGLLLHFWYLKRVLRHLDPSSVIPGRVRATLDTLAEGVLVLNKERRIVLANKAFARSTGRSPEELQGVRADDIRWSESNPGAEPADWPWKRAIEEGVAQTGVMLALQQTDTRHRTFAVNTMPIHAGDGSCRGALVTFDDVTSIEEKNQQLEQMLQSLQSSRDEIHRQNTELTLLATRDPLTSCLNRRAFFSHFQMHWETAWKEDRPLSCIMVDIDHFKSINDRFGHATGDEVLQVVSTTLLKNVPSVDPICRYGGEEFCILLPGTSLDLARQISETLRVAISSLDLNMAITASFGLSTIGQGAKEPNQLLEQADQALYASKRRGRNRVTSWTEVSADQQLKYPSTGRANTPGENGNDTTLPFHAVAALSSALAYRDARTAEHSRRVADLCVLLGRGLMSERDCYVLEVAALLHDIGKLGVPDSILLKPGPLTPAEWSVMSAHDRIGVEIIRAAFSSDELAEIIGCHHLRYDGSASDERSPQLPSCVGNEIPVRARILTIADAYDAMVSDRIYRKGRTPEEAFVELRRCADKQFDPELVERLIQVVSGNDRQRAEVSSLVTKQAALRIGLQIERLAAATDSRDFPTLSALAGRLASTAINDGVPEIAELAHELEQTISDDPDILEVVRLTSGLLELCRATQSCHLEAGQKSIPPVHGAS